MKKKIVIILIIALALTGGALGYDLIKINVEQAKQLAITNDKNIAIDELYLQADQLDFEEAKKEAATTERSSYYGQITFYYTPFISETEVTLTTMENERSILYLEKEIVSLSYDYYILENSYEQTLSSYEQAVTAYNEATLDQDTTATELMRFEYEMKAAGINRDKAMNAYMQAKDSLEALINEGNIIDVDALEISSPYDIDVTLAIEKAMENNLSIYSSDRSMQAKKIILDITADHYSKVSSKSINAQADYEKAEINYDKAVLQLEVDVINDLDNLKSYYDAIELERLNNEIKKADYEGVMKQYEKGFISYEGLTAKKAVYDNAVNQLLQREKTYILALKDFEINTCYNK